MAGPLSELGDAFKGELQRLLIFALVIVLILVAYFFVSIFH